MLRRLILLAAAILAVSGCGLVPTADPAAGSSPSSPLATYVTYGSGSDTALLKGTLVLNAGCLYVEVPDGVNWVPAFPVDEVEWGDGKLNYQGSTYVSGDEIALGGGTGNSLQGVSMPESCRATDVWQVGQTD